MYSVANEDVHFKEYKKMKTVVKIRNMCHKIEIFQTKNMKKHRRIYNCGIHFNRILLFFIEGKFLFVAVNNMRDFILFFHSLESIFLLSQNFKTI